MTETRTIDVCFYAIEKDVDILLNDNFVKNILKGFWVCISRLGLINGIIPNQNVKNT